MKIKLLNATLTGLVILGAYTAKAQQDPYATHYAFNRMLYNPAVAGAGDRYCFSALSHHQYLGYEDRTPEFWPQTPGTNAKPAAVKSVGPKTQMFSASAPITRYGGLGIGFINDKLGYETSTHIKIDAAGRLPLGNGATIALGFEVNFLRKGLDGTLLKPLVSNDPSIPTQNVGESHPIFGGGLYYTDPMANSTKYKNLWGGFSILNLNSPAYTFGPQATSFSVPVKHYYLMGGITIQDFLGNPNLQFHPSLMFKRAGVNQIDLTALVEYQNKLWGGLAYRSTADAVSVMLGYSGFKNTFQGLRIGYSYDLTLTRILSVSSGTHEIQLNYCFDFKYTPPEKVPLVTPPFMHRDSD